MKLQMVDRTCLTEGDLAQCVQGGRPAGSPSPSRHESPDLQIQNRDTLNVIEPELPLEFGRGGRPVGLRNDRREKPERVLLHQIHGIDDVSIQRLAALMY